jgi:hypothetical protein
MTTTLKVHWNGFRTQAVIYALKARRVDAEPLPLYFSPEAPGEVTTIKLSWTRGHLDQAETALETWLGQDSRELASARSGWPAGMFRPAVLPVRAKRDREETPMAVFKDMDNRAQVPADYEAALALAGMCADAAGKPVSVYKRGADFLVTTAPEPGSRWTCIYRCTPEG